MKNYIFLTFFILKAFESLCFNAYPPDSILSNSKVVLDINLENNKVKEIKYFRDSLLICSQKYIFGKLSNVIINDANGVILEAYSLFQNGQISNSKKYKDGLLEEEIIFSKRGRIQIIFYYNRGVMVDYVNYGKNGQPKKKLRR